MVKKNQLIIDNGDSRLKDKVFRLNNIYKIKNINKRIIPFRMNRAQLEFHQKKTNRNIILKSRKLGFTTYFAIDALDECLFEKNTDALMLSYDIPSQLDIFDDKIVLAWENIHEEIKTLYTLDANRANKLKFNWGDKSTTSITVRSHGRSGTYSKLHISEFAKICKEDPSSAKEIISGTIQAVPLSGEVNIESTAEGDYGQFYNIFLEAWKRGKPKTPVDFTAFFFNWTYDDAELDNIVPIAEEDLPAKFVEYKVDHGLTDREITYYYLKWLTLGRDWKLLRREYPTTVEEAFEAAGDRFFDGESVRHQKASSPSEVGKWKYYLDYKPGHRYAMAVDPSEGIGQDNAVCAVWDFSWKDQNGVSKPKIAAMFCDDLTKPDELARVAKDGATRYGNCLVAVERNNHGHTTIAILKGMYYNLYKEMKTDERTDTETERIGWHSNLATKPKMLYDFRTALLENSIDVSDGELISELLSFPSNEVSKMVRDPGGKHWDRVTAAAVGFQMKDFATNTLSFSVSEDGQFDRFAIF